MVRYKVVFDNNFLDELKETENSGVEICKSIHHIALHPVQLNNFNESIKDVLNGGVAKYNKELEGILLGYQNIKFFNNEGYIHNDSCYIHLDLQAEFYIFKPDIDKEMQGIVNRISKDHVGLLVYNTFNVSIPKPKSDEHWQGELVDIGYEVLFKITYFSFSSCMPYIRGEIISIIKESENFVENVSANMVQKKANKKILFEDDTIELPSKSKKKKLVLEDKCKAKQAENSYQDKKQKKSKKKKDKINEEEHISLGDLNIEELFNMI